MYKWTINIYNQINLENIEYSEHRWHFRFASNYQAIDIWEDVTGNTAGRLTNWTKECEDNGGPTTKRVFAEQNELSSSQVNRIVALIDSSQIRDLPDQYSIDKWDQGFDGITYIIESASDTDYYFKSYWTPDAQDSLREAVVVQNFVMRILTIADASENWEDFDKRIPFECYTYGGMMLKCRSWGKND